MNDLLQAFVRGDPRALLGTLVLISMLLHIFGSNVAWHYRAVPSSPFVKALRQFALSPFSRAFYEILRLLYYVVVPFTALLLGWLDIRAFGLGYVDWADGLRWTIVLALAAWSLLMFVWVPYLRATSHLPVRFKSETQSWSRRVVEVFYMQAHWAFYRAACILILSSFFKDNPAVYWGTCAGLGLILIEAWADPRVRRQIAQVGEGELALWSAGQAIVNTLGFAVTRNTWLLALLHLVLEFSVPHLRPTPQPVPTRIPSPPVKVGDTRRSST